MRKQRNFNKENRRRGKNKDTRNNQYKNNEKQKIETIKDMKDVLGIKSKVIYGKNIIQEYFNSKQVSNSIKIYVSNKFKDKKDMQIENILNQAEKLNIPIVYSGEFFLNETQGILLEIQGYTYSTVHEIINKCKERYEKSLNKENKQYGLILILDKIEDVHNLGAIIRTSEILGVDGIIIPEHKSADINNVVFKVSAGAASHMSIAKVTNINYLIDELKENEYWIVSTDMDNSTNITKQDFKMNIALVIGNEGKGVSKLTKEKSDIIVNIPMIGKTESLNASVSAGISIYEIQRNRGVLDI